MPASPLKPYQKQAVRFALTHPHCGLFLDMGLGKTLISIAIMDITRRRHENLHWLIVMPPQLVRQHTWQHELSKWAAWHDLTSQTLDMPPKPRERVCRNARQPDVTIISSSQLAWLDATIRNWPWNALIIDELSAYRNTRSQRFRALKRHRHAMRRIIGLTGTPVPKSLDNLWGEIALLDGGTSLGTSLTRYRLRWFTPGQRNWQTGVIYDWQPQTGAFDQIMHAIKPFCLSMSRHDQTPEQTDPILDIITGRMPDTTRNAYDRLRHDMAVNLDPGMVTAVNAGTLTDRLTQLTAGFLYPDRASRTVTIPLPDTPTPPPPAPYGTIGGRHVVSLQIAGTHRDDDTGQIEPDVDGLLDDHTRIRLDPGTYRVDRYAATLTVRPEPLLYDRMVRDLDTMKLTLLDRLLERLDGQPLLLFYRYRRELQRLKTRYGRRLHTLDEPDAQDRWNQGRIPILALQPSSSQYGLNLQHGGHHVCWTTLTWDSEQWSQANARLNRTGQTSRVTVHVLAAERSIDQRILDVLQGRLDLQRAVLTALSDTPGA